MTKDPRDLVDDPKDLCPRVSEELLEYLQIVTESDRDIPPKGLTAHEWHCEIGKRAGKRELIRHLQEVHDYQVDKGLEKLEEHSVRGA